MENEGKIQLRGFVLTPLLLLMATVLWNFTGPGISFLLFILGLVIFALTVFDLLSNRSITSDKKLKLSAALVFATFSLSWLFASSVFGQSRKDSFSIDVPDNAKNTYEKVVQVCPGFALYASSITFERFETNDYVWYDGDTQSGLTSIYFKITGDIDADPVARGNTCRYVLTKKEDRIISQKEACAALCLGHPVDLHGENFETKIP